MIYKDVFPKYKAMRFYGNNEHEIAKFTNLDFYIGLDGVSIQLVDDHSEYTVNKMDFVVINPLSGEIYVMPGYDYYENFREA